MAILFGRNYCLLRKVSAEKERLQAELKAVFELVGTPLIDRNIDVKYSPETCSILLILLFYVILTITLKNIEKIRLGQSLAGPASAPLAVEFGSLMTPD